MRSGLYNLALIKYGYLITEAAGGQAVADCYLLTVLLREKRSRLKSSSFLVSSIPYYHIAYFPYKNYDNLYIRKRYTGKLS